jgi:hypothetical protein
MKILLMGSEFFRADGQTDVYDVASSRLLKFCKRTCNRTCVQRDSHFNAAV